MLAVRACSRSRVQNGLRTVALNKAIRVDASSTPHRSWHRGMANSTQASPSGDGSVGTYLLASAGVVLGGLAGYYFAGPASNSPTNDRPIRLNDQYGTPQDFENAIKDLRHALPAEGRVSTEPNVLASHSQPFGSDRTSTYMSSLLDPNGL